MRFNKDEFNNNGVKNDYSNDKVGEFGNDDLKIKNLDASKIAKETDKVREFDFEPPEFDGKSTIAQRKPIQYQQNHQQQVQQNPQEAAKKLSTALKGVISTVTTTTVVAVAAAVVVTDNNILKESSATLEFSDIYATSAAYEVVLDSEEAAKLYIKSDFESYTIDLEAGQNIGALETLTPGMTYNAKVVVESTFNTTLCRGSFKTLTVEPPFIYITYETNGGTLFEQTKIRSGNLLPRPPTPEKTGYIFEGWYIDSDFVTKFNFNDTVGESLTLYAKYTPNIYTITFNANGGSMSETQLVVASGASFELPTPSKVGFDFNGWYSDSTLNNQFDNTMSVIEDLTLYAGYLGHTHTITFEPGDGILETETMDVTNGVSYTLPTPDLEGFTSKWYTDELFNNEFEVGTILTEDITLYANYEMITAIITMNPGIGEIVETGNTLQVSYWDEYSLPTPQAVGHEFENWYTESTFDNVFYESTPITSDITIYARFTANTYTLTLEPRSGYIPEDDKIMHITYGDSYELPQPIVDGFTAKWYLDDNTFENEFVSNTLFAEDITIYAKYIPIQFTLTFDVGDGEFVDNAGESIVVTYGTEYSLPMVTSTTGFFTKWKSGEMNIAIEGTWLYSEIPSTELTANYFQYSDMLNITYVENSYAVLGLKAPEESQAFDSFMLDIPESTLEIVIPNTYNDGSHGEYPVRNVKINANNQYNSNIYSVILQSNVTTIEDYAFSDCINLSMFDFGSNSGVYSIGDHAFAGLNALSYITIPNSVHAISDNAFYQCQNLTSLEFEEGFESLTIGSYAFNNCFVDANSSANIILPNTTTSIGQYAFKDCIGIGKISFTQGASTLSTIDDNTFEGCTNLESICIPSTVTDISTYAFKDCSALTKVYYYGTSSQKENINIATGNTVLNNATWFYFTANGSEETSTGNWWYLDEGEIIELE